MNGAGKPSSAEVIRRHADEVVYEYPHDDLVTLAAEIEEDVGFYDEGRTRIWLLQPSFAGEQQRA